MDEVVMAALEKGLDPTHAPARHANEPHFDIDELGVPRLRLTRGDTTVITDELLNQLRERESI